MRAYYYMDNGLMKAHYYLEGEALQVIKVQIVDKVTKEVVKEMTAFNPRQAEQIARGVAINIDKKRYAILVGGFAHV